MLNFILNFSLGNRGFVCLISVLLTGFCFYAALRVNIDAVPDITSPQIQINLVVDALAPEEVEKQISVPLESAMSGLPGLVELRSLSKAGLSQITLVFEDGVDLYRLRQMVSERLNAAEAELPSGVVPELAPMATGLGEIFYYSLDYREDYKDRPDSREEELRTLRQMHDRLVKPMLRATPGLAEVNTSGGYEREIRVQPNLARLAASGMSVDQLANILAENMQNAGGGSVDIGGEQLIVRSSSRVETTSQIKDIPLKFTLQLRPLTVGDVATVVISSGVRYGASTADGKEALIGAAILYTGANSRIVSKEIREKLQHIQKKLPPEFVITPLYDRSNLILRTIHTVQENLAGGALLVIVILFVLLGNWRGALIVALVIPLSMLMALMGMFQWHLTGNLMSLGAIDFGLIIDGAVVMVENILRHIGLKQAQLGRLLSNQERREEVGVAAREVAAPMFFGVLVITIVYLPLMSLEGIEGKMFKPMAIVVMMALGASLVLSLTLIPCICSFWLKEPLHESGNFIMHGLNRLYRLLLGFCQRFKWVPLTLSLTLFVLGVHLGSKLGADFIPQLDEGDLVLQLIRSSSASLDSSIELQLMSEKILLKNFPEIEHVFSRIGTAEVATDPMNPNASDTYILLKPISQWRKISGKAISKEELGELMRKTLLDLVPGQNVLVTQPIQLRFNEIMAGARADLVCKVFGPDYTILEGLATEVREVMATISGGKETEFDNIGRNPMLEILPDRQKLLQQNVHAEDLNRMIETALAGKEVGHLVESGGVFVPVVIKLSEHVRSDLEAMKQLILRTDEGNLLPLSRLADIQIRDQPIQMVREGTMRKVSVLVNVRGRDTLGFVEEASTLLEQKIKFPAGYYFEFGGQYENLVKAKEKLMVIVPLALLAIFILIYAHFESFSRTAMIYLGVPLAVSGGLIALWLRDMPFTISAAVGFIAVSGIAVLNGIMLFSFLVHMDLAKNLRSVILEGAVIRLRPQLMTALVAALGLVPMALSEGAGAEVQRPLATVVIGGIFTSTLLTLFVLPVLFEWLEQRKTVFLKEKK